MSNMTYGQVGYSSRWLGVSAPYNVLGLTCASHMLPPGREVQAERPGS
jgi:hypothetical protein